jgi:hypothetical protein
VQERNGLLEITRKNGVHTRRLVVNLGAEPVAFTIAPEWRTMVSSGTSSETHIGAHSALVLART